LGGGAASKIIFGGRYQFVEGIIILSFTDLSHEFVLCGIFNRVPEVVILFFSNSKKAIFFKEKTRNRAFDFFFPSIFFS